MKFCTNCGYKMAEDVKFCPKCGAEQDNVEQAKTTQNSTVAQPSVIRNNKQTNYQSRSGNFILGQPQHLNFGEALSYSWKYKLDFNPIMADNQKSIYWWMFLILCLINLVPMFVIYYPSSAYGSTGGVLIYYVIAVILGLFQIPPLMRRLNYLGRNKNIAWLTYVPIANFYPFYLSLINKPER